jgi:hypothetical protein
MRSSDQPGWQRERPLPDTHEVWKVRFSAARRRQWVDLRPLLTQLQTWQRLLRARLNASLGQE